MQMKRRLLETARARSNVTLVAGVCVLGLLGGTVRDAFGAETSPGDAPRVRVENIGLHIGGGPNDPKTKAPFLRQIATEFDAFRLCYAKAEGEGARGTFGIDLLVPKEGGHAETSNARTAMKGAAFRDCVVDAFRAVVFEPPKHGRTKLSYALRFEPE
jgi:hypothetical protein